MALASQMPALPYYRASFFHLSSKCPESKFLFISCLQGTDFPCNRQVQPRLCFLCLAAPLITKPRQMRWPVRSMVDDSKSDPSGSSTSGGTRLIRVFQAFQAKLNARVKELRKGLLMKILFFLIGFYCSTAFSTVIGQTGDWDILSAGLAVVIVEAIGALMYRTSLRMLRGVRNLIAIFNYWKAGLSLGLFLDAFKYEIDTSFCSRNPFQIEIDLFSLFW